MDQPSYEKPGPSNGPAKRSRKVNNWLKSLFVTRALSARFVLSQNLTVEQITDVAYSPHLPCGYPEILRPQPRLFGTPPAASALVIRFNSAHWFSL
jgi:hypothetical protein